MSEYFDDRQPDIAMAALLLDIRTDVKVLLERSAVQKIQNADHEKRLRTLERFRYAWPSAAALGSLAALAMASFTIFH